MVGPTQGSGNPIRLDRPPILQIVPYHHFSKASSECWDMFDAGHYYGCISLVQAVAEGLSRFVARVNSLRDGDHEARVRTLRRRGLLSEEVEAAFLRIDSDRNDFHHMNPGVETQADILAERSRSCLEDLYVIECDIFAYTTRRGRIAARHERYWPRNEDGTGPVFLRMEPPAIPPQAGEPPESTEGSAGTG